MGSLPSGSVFAGFRIDSVIARGGMGVVYLADQEHPHRRVALKLIAPERVDDPAYRERFLRESELLAGLEHPNIVPIHAAGEWEGNLYLAMRYVDGPTLAQRLKDDGPLSVDETVRILAPVADALDTAHEMGLIHRDVKPANILLSQRGHVYLTDFGLTKRAGSMSGLTMPGMAIGTEGYMAPEQFTGTGDPDLAYRIDIYALGCVIHACLTGKEPFPRDSYEAVMWAHVFAPPPRVSDQRPDLGTRFDDALKRAMAKDPAERHATARELVEELWAAGLASTPSEPAPQGAMAELAEPTVVAPIPDATAGQAYPDAGQPESAWTAQAAEAPADVIAPPVGERSDAPPGAAGSSPGTRRRWSIAMLAVAGVIVLVAGFLGVRAFLGPRTGPIASPPPSAVPAATTQAYGSLWSALPASVGQCHDPGDRRPGSLARIHCRETGGTPALELIYQTFPDRATLDAAWSDFLRQQNIAAGSGGCPTGRGETGWPTGAPVEKGRLLCYESSAKPAEAVIEKTFFEKTFLDAVVWEEAWQPGGTLATVDGLVASGVYDLGPSTVEITAANGAFMPTETTVLAGKEWRIRLRNDDPEVLHGVRINRGGPGGEQVFDAPPFVGADTQTFKIPQLTAGDYRLVDPAHPEITATITVKD